MSDPSFDILEYQKSRIKYIDGFTLSVDPVNPLLNVVPLVNDFFATKVCNIVCLNGPLVDWDWDSVATTVTILKATYDKFQRYETHFLIDGDADKAPSESQLSEMDSNFATLVADLGEYGIFYYGKLNATALSTTINEILDSFV
jgi:hypothetical protein